jgi:hypothetical protein
MPRAGPTGGICETQSERPWPFHLYPPARPLFFRVGTEELYIHLISLARRNDLLVTYRLSSTGGATITAPPPLRHRRDCIEASDSRSSTGFTMLNRTLRN